MALKQREKILAAVTALLILAVVGRFLFSAWWGPIKRLRADRASLQTKVDEKQNRVDRSRSAQARLSAWRSRSLPSDPGIARSLYQNWLFQLAKEVGFDGTKLDVTGDGRQLRRVGAYRTLSFTLQADAKLDELTEFLYKFYSVDLLHRIRTLTIERTEGSDNLPVRLTVEALSLPNADAAIAVTKGTFDTETNFTPDLKPELVYTGSKGKLAHEAEFWLTGIKESSQFGFRGTEALNDVRDKINAQKDKTGVVATVDGDKLYLRDDKASSDSPSTWLAASGLDEYRKAIGDRNLFAKYKPPSAPPGEGPRPPEPPRFDPCKHAYLTAIVRGINDEPEAWMIARTTGQKLALCEGDTFELGDVRAKVIHINRRDTEIEVDGKRWLMFMGDSLREAKPLFEEPDEEESAADQPSEQESADEEPAVDQPSEQESAEEGPGVDQSSEQESREEEPAVDQSSEEESGEEGPGVDQSSEQESREEESGPYD